MINRKLNISKAFIEQMDKCIILLLVQSHNIFLETQKKKEKTRVFVLLMFYEIRKNTKKAFKVLSCVIYTIINNNVCIDYLPCKKNPSELNVGSGGVFKHGKKVMTIYLEL